MSALTVRARPNYLPFQDPLLAGSLREAVSLAGRVFFFFSLSLHAAAFKGIILISQGCCVRFLAPLPFICSLFLNEIYTCGTLYTDILNIDIYIYIYK